MSLIEALILLGVLSIASVGVMSLTEIGSKTTKSQNAENDLAGYFASLRLAINEAAICQNTGLVGMTIDPATPATTDIDLSTPSASGPVVAQPILKNNWDIPGGHWRVTSSRFTSMVDQGPVGVNVNLYLSMLEIRLQKTGTQNIGSNTRTETIPMNVAINTGTNQVQFCYAQFRNQPAYSTCAWVYPPLTMGGPCTAPNCATKPNWAVASCPPGQFLAGHHVKRSRNTDEDSEFIVLPTEVRGRRQIDGSWMKVNAYCCY